MLSLQVDACTLVHVSVTNVLIFQLKIILCSNSQIGKWFITFVYNNCFTENQTQILTSYP